MAKKAEQAKKANEKATSKKSTAKKGEESEGARAALHAQTIKLLSKENPRREGTAVHKIFAAMKNGQTVGEFLAATEKLGGKMSHIRKSEKKGWISLK